MMPLSTINWGMRLLNGWPPWIDKETASAIAGPGDDKIGRPFAGGPECPRSAPWRRRVDRNTDRVAARAARWAEYRKRLGSERAVIERLEPASVRLLLMPPYGHPDFPARAEGRRSRVQR